MNDLAVFVPTRGRIDNQITKHGFWLDDCPAQVVYIVPQSEKREYQRRWKESRVVTVSNEFHIGDIHDWVVRRFSNYKKHIVIDDDCKLLHCPDAKTARKATREQSLTFWREASKWLDQYAYAGITSSSFHTLAPYPSQENSRVLNIHMYRRDIIWAEGIVWGQPCMGDLNCVLTTIELGYAVYLSNQWAVQSKNWQPGGCSEYRTADMTERMCRKLAAEHEFVSLRPAKANTNQLGMDTTIRWKKSFGIRSSERKLKSPGVKTCY